MKTLKVSDDNYESEWDSNVRKQQHGIGSLSNPDFKGFGQHLLFEYRILSKIQLSSLDLGKFIYFAASYFVHNKN